MTQWTESLWPSSVTRTQRPHHCWPFSHKIFAAVCAQTRWMRPSAFPAAKMSPVGPYYSCFKARRVLSARSSVVMAQAEIHDVGLAVEQAEQAHPKHDARVAVPEARARAPGCMAFSAVTRTHGVMWRGALPAAPVCGGSSSFDTSSRPVVI